MLSGVMKSSELSKIFRRKELTDNPTAVPGDAYELSLQHSLLQPRESSKSSPLKSDNKKFRVDYPRNMPFSSDAQGESVYTTRNHIRTNVFNHLEYRPELAMPDLAAISKAVYNKKDPAVTQEILDQPVAEYITESGVYKSMKYRLCDVFNEMNRVKEEARANDILQKKQATKREKAIKNKAMSKNMLPPGVKMFNAPDFVKKLTESVEEKKDV
jgi:hypothetical protein